MRLHHVTHNISRDNRDAATRFYRDLLGLVPIPATEDPEGRRLVWFQLGGHQLHLVIRDSADPQSSRHLAVVVDDFDRTLERIEREGGRVDVWEDGRPYRTRRNGTRSTFCYDPDGNRIELMDGGRE